MVPGSPLNAYELLNPEFAQLLDGMAAIDKIDAEMLASARTSVPGLGSTAEVERIDFEIGAERALKVRIHRPRKVEGPLPSVYSMHGGGYVVGSYDLDDPVFESWCPKLGILGV